MSAWRTANRLGLRALVGGGRRDKQLLGLSVIAVAIALTVGALTVGAISALESRDHRGDWTRPAPVAAARASALQAVTPVAIDGHRVIVVRLAARPHAAKPPVPPGMTAFPKPGTAAWSPALRELLTNLPGQAAALNGADGNASTLGSAALDSPGALVAVLGVSHRNLKDSPAWNDVVDAGSYAAPTRIADFDGAASADDATARQYVYLAEIAAILLLVPVLTLIGAAVRLGTKRRALRLAALRLAGAPATVIRRLLFLEVGFTTLAAAAIAWPVSQLLAFAISHARVGGSDFYAGDLMLGPIAWVVMILGSALIMLGSALPAVWDVLRDPLATVGSHTPRRLGWWRIGIAAVIVAAFLQVSKDDEVSRPLILLVFAGMFSLLNVVGPLAAELLGRFMLHISKRRGPAVLLAARRILDDPRAVWRLVSGVVLAAFVAGFLAMFQIDNSPPGAISRDSYEVVVPKSSANTAVKQARKALDRIGHPLPVRRGEPNLLWSVNPGDPKITALTVRVPPNASAAEVDRIHGALQEAFPGMPAVDTVSAVELGSQFSKDFVLAAVVVMLVSLLVAAAATAITVAATTLDRREVYRRMWQVGTPVEVLDRARTLESFIPLAAGTALALGAGVVTAAPLTLGTGGISLSGVGLLFATTGLGLAIAVAAVRGSRPLVTAVARTR